MRQPLEFFEKENTSGNITRILACDVKAINNATIDFVIMIFHGVSLTIFAIVLCCFIFVWFSIISIVIMPPMIVAIFANHHIQSKNLLKDKEDAQKENMIVSDSIINHLTISSLSAEEIITERYLGMNEQRKTNFWRTLKYLIVIAFIYGLSCYLTQVVSYLLIIH